MSGLLDSDLSLLDYKPILTQTTLPKTVYDNISEFDPILELHKFIGYNDVINDEETTDINPPTDNNKIFYETWRKEQEVEKLNATMKSYLLRDLDVTVNFSTRLDNVTVLTNFILYIYFINSEILDINGETTGYKPLLVASGKKKYYTSVLITLASYLKNIRGAGNTTVELICTENLLAFNGGDSDVSDFTIKAYRTEVSKSKSLRTWCGCFTPVISLVEQYPECDPLCVSQFPIQRVNTLTYDNIVCRANICVIDDNIINVVNTEVDITFNQICAGCNNGSPCFCYLDVTLPGILDGVGSDLGGLKNPVSFNQVCGGGNICFKENEKGERETFECNPFNPADTSEAIRTLIEGKSLAEKYKKVPNQVWFVFVLILSIFIVATLAVIFEEARISYRLDGYFKKNKKK